MIKNVVFDMGNVLIEWQPVQFLKRIGVKDKKDIEIILDNSIRKKHWHEYDFGLISLDELVEGCTKHVPERLKKAAKTFAVDWPAYANEIEGIREYTHYLQDKGYKIYVLSNAGRNQPYYIRRFHYDYFDGTCISAFYKTGKPEKKFFEAFLKKYHLKAEECVFTDDILANVEGARKAGIKAYQFKNTEKLKKDLKL